MSVNFGVRLIHSNEVAQHTYNACSLVGSESVSKLFSINPELTTTHRDQCSAVCMGRNNSFFRKKFTLSFLFCETILSGPFAFRLLMKWDEKK